MGEVTKNNPKPSKHRIELVVEAFHGERTVPAAVNHARGQWPRLFGLAVRDAVIRPANGKRDGRKHRIELCVVCEGRGELKPERRRPTYADRYAPAQQCHGCGGRGWIELQGQAPAKGRGS